MATLERLGEMGGVAIERERVEVRMNVGRGSVHSWRLVHIQHTSLSVIAMLCVSCIT